MIEDLIDLEMQYFKPMLQRAKEATDEQRVAWRQETILDRQRRIAKETHQLCGGQVKYGPFKGLKLTSDAWWGGLDLGSQCLGLYEREILNLIELIPRGRYAQFVDIGAGDGYYAVGMLLSGKVETAICFEASPKGKDTIQRNWEANGKPGNLVIHGTASAENLSDLDLTAATKTFVIIDIEGNEFSLLDSSVLRALSTADIILEVHNWAPNFETVYPEFLRRAAQYFQIEVLERINRDATQIHELRSFTDDNRLLLTSERRPCLMRFLNLQPLSGH